MLGLDFAVTLVIKGGHQSFIAFSFSFLCFYKILMINVKLMMSCLLVGMFLIYVVINMFTGNHHFKII